MLDVYNFTAISPSVSTSSPPEEETESVDKDEKFDWFSQWYALMPVCDLDKRAPVGKKVMGLDVVVWWDKSENAWNVFDDKCPHRLAPLSEGRIDEWGRLQCVYHGWCFGGSGDCKLIPQAPLDGPAVHTFPKACVAVYPSTVQNGIVWFWPNIDPRYKDILTKKKPPYVPELDDPAFTFQMFNRDIPYGYEVLTENLMDPSHIPYAHYGETSTKTTSKDTPDLYMYSSEPRWVQHIGQNLIIDSDLCLLHAQEKKLNEVGQSNWQKVCFVPTKADANVVAYRKWLNKYAGGQINWGTKFDGPLPATPPRDQLMDRYWSHVVNCSSCNGAYKGLNALKVALQMFSVASVAIVAVTRQGMISVTARNMLASLACLQLKPVGSRCNISVSTSLMFIPLTYSILLDPQLHPANISDPMKFKH
ncbi:hypothetical protein L1987_37476 [Smallanthus sonchifolius]|uniref:Uncharacterized protein n=1 Tax=Smallanthus sonchifolius TaxID=185202 RepID=A0ACB9HHP9_9ASTR|nr:hypothetical protein L1987_37476 [Smallanthus sonchifolius]